MPMNRRKFIKTGAVGVLGLAGQAAESRGTSAGLSDPTPPEVEGPFYPVTAQKDTDFDLTQVVGRGGEALGEHIFVEGGVFDTEGNPIEDAKVELWQANAAGRYAHPRDQNPAPLDKSFQGWAVVPSGKKGEFRFKSVFPGIYNVAANWSRPPHIHFKVTKKGFKDLTTQMYFPDHPLNQIDGLIQRKTKSEQARMIATEVPGEERAYRFPIILQKA